MFYMIDKYSLNLHANLYNLFVMWIVTDDDYMSEKVSKLHLTNNANRNGSNTFSKLDI